MGYVMKSLQKVSLLKQEREAVEMAVETLQQAVPIERVILFGSKARGDADDCSDFDLLLLTARPLHWTEEKAIVETLFCPHTVPDMCTGLHWLRGERAKPGAGGLPGGLPSYPATGARVRLGETPSEDTARCGETPA